MKFSMGLLLSICTFLANAYPDDFHYDENRQKCVNNNDPTITAEKIDGV